MQGEYHGRTEGQKDQRVFFPETQILSRYRGPFLEIAALICQHNNLGEGTMATSVNHPFGLEIYWGPKKEPRTSVGLPWFSLAEDVSDQVNSLVSGEESLL